MARLSVECYKFLNPSFLQNINPATLLKTQFLHFVSAEYQFMPCPMQIVTKLHDLKAA